MSRVHSYILYLATVIILIFALKTSLWDSRSSGRPSSLPKMKVETPLSSTNQLAASFEEKIFEFQAKLSYASAKDAPAPLREAALRSLRQSVEELSKRKALSLGLRGKLIASASYFEFQEEKARACHELEIASPDRTGESSERFLKEEGIISKLCNSSSEEFDYSRAEIEEISSSLGWFTVLLSNKISSKKLKQEIQQRAAINSEATLKKAATISALIMAVLGSSSILFILACMKFARGGFKAQFQQGGYLSLYCLEIFCIYLSSMMFMPEIISGLALPGGKSSILGLNSLFILSLSFLLLLPLAQGISFSELREALGLKVGGASRFLKDLLIGPLAYWTSISLLLTCLALYSLLLAYLEVDPSSGAHPLVPTFMSSGNKSASFLIIFLAVVVAPLVEELMFRGAFYSWLRSQMSATLAIFCSSLIFAALHPQGIIGVLPLMIIGIVLALLREWRGNLTSCIVAHACFNGATLLLLKTVSS